MTAPTSQRPRALRTLALGVPLALAACSGKRPVPAASDPEPAATAAASDATAPPQTEAEKARHRVVFADRTSHAYLLLLPPGADAKPPSREDLARLVREAFEDRLEDEEVRLLLELIATDPDTTRGPVGMGQTDDALAAQSAARLRDVLGLYIDVLPVAGEGDRPLIVPRALVDPVLTRALDPDERRSLPDRSQALLLRAEYRNRHAVRGLRLLQTLVPLVAHKTHALIHDWDTGETLDVDTFEARRLRANLGNVADQIAVVPFPDRTHTGPGGAPMVRLTTRGMRRFGSPDLELDGLPRDPQVLQDGTFLLMGLASQVARAAELHSTGFAQEAEDVLTIHAQDVAQAYSSREGAVPRCASCPETTYVHLVRRPALPDDPRGHPVVRVVAPREVSDAPDYDHVAWVREALADLLGSSRQRP